MARKYPFSPILGWSNTRYETFSACRLRYYYQYYSKYDSEFGLQKIEALRDLTSVPLQIGSITHDCIASLLRRLQREPTAPIDSGRLSSFIANKANESIQSCNFSEVYYGELAAIEVESLQLPVAEAFKNLLESKRFQWIMTDAGPSSAKWLIEPDRYGETRIDGLKAYCKVDFLFPVESRFYILDWKTGKEHQEKHEVQIRGYAAWACQAYGTSVANINPVIAYLVPEYHERTLTLAEEDMPKFAGMVRSQTQQMYQLRLSDNSATLFRVSPDAAG